MGRNVQLPAVHVYSQHGARGVRGAVFRTGLTKTRRADGSTGRTTGQTEWPVVPSVGVTQGMGPPSCAPVYDGPLNCRPLLRT